MKTNALGLEIIREFEGCSLKAYQDGSPARLWTIGWGCTHGVHEGMEITQAEADERLSNAVASTESVLLLLTAPCLLNENQFSALVSFCYNVGFGHVAGKDGFQILKNGDPSTMLKLLWAHDYAGAADEFPKWCKVGGVPCAGILRRRMAEKALFQKEVSDAAN